MRREKPYGILDHEFGPAAARRLPTVRPNFVIKGFLLCEASKNKVTLGLTVVRPDFASVDLFAPAPLLKSWARHRRGQTLLRSTSYAGLRLALLPLLRGGRNSTTLEVRLLSVDLRRYKGALRHWTWYGALLALGYGPLKPSRWRGL